MKRVLRALMLELDYSAAQKMWHPIVNRGCLEKLETGLLSMQYQGLSMTHMLTEVVTIDNQDEVVQDYFAELRECGHNADELAFSSYYVMSLVDGEERYDECVVVFANEGGQIYVINVEC